VLDMLLALPGHGRVKATKILNSCRVSPSKTFGGLSERQRKELAVRLEEDHAHGAEPSATIASPRAVATETGQARDVAAGGATDALGCRGGSAVSASPIFRGRQSGVRKAKSRGSSPNVSLGWGGPTTRAQILEPVDLGRVSDFLGFANHDQRSTRPAQRDRCRRSQTPRVPEPKPSRSLDPSAERKTTDCVSSSKAWLTGRIIAGCPLRAIRPTPPAPAASIRRHSSGAISTDSIIGSRTSASGGSSCCRAGEPERAQQPLFLLGGEIGG
jgi:hypothetical protein